MKAERILERAYDRWDRRYADMTIPHLHYHGAGWCAYGIGWCQHGTDCPHTDRRVLLEQADALVQRLTALVYGSK